MSKRLISDKEAEDLIKWCQNRGMGDQLVMKVLAQRDYDLKVAAEKRRVAKLRAEQEKKREEYKKQMMEELYQREITVDSNALKTFDELSRVDQMIELQNYNAYQRKKDENWEDFTIEDYREELGKSYVDIGAHFQKRLDQISASKNTWKENKGMGDKKHHARDQILDYRNDDFVAGTLTREFEKDGFWFKNDSAYTDSIKAYFRDADGEVHSIRIHTNFVGGGGSKERAQAHKLEAWMRDMYEKKFDKGTDYKPIADEDGTMHWHYVDSAGNSLGKVKANEVKNLLNELNPDFLDPHRQKSFKYDAEGTLLMKERFGDEEDWVIVEDEQIKINMEVLYKDAKQEAIDRGEGQEEVLLYHNLSKVNYLKNADIKEKEYQRRKNTSIEDYYHNEGWYDLKIGKAGSKQRLKNIFSGTAWKHTWNSAKRAVGYDSKGEYYDKSYELAREDYNAWIEEARAARIPYDMVDDDIVSPYVYEYDEETGDYTITSKEIKRLEELNIKPADDQLSISEEEYQYKVLQHNKKLTSTGAKDIEGNWSPKYKGKNSASLVWKISNSVLDENYTDEQLYENFKPGEYQYQGQIVDISKEDIDFINEFNKHLSQYSEENYDYERAEEEHANYLKRYYIPQNERFADLLTEMNLEETSSERKQEIKKYIKENQSNWSKFYDLSDFEGMDIDLEALEKYITNEMTSESGSLRSTQLEILTAAATGGEHGGKKIDTGLDDRWSAGLLWDDKKGKWFWSGGVHIDADARNVGEHTEIDNIKAKALMSFIGSQSSELEERAYEYEQVGLYNTINKMNEFNANVVELDRELTDAVEKYDALKSDIDSGKVEKTDEKVDELNSLSGYIEALGERINANVGHYNRLSNNEWNQVLFDNYNNLIDESTKLKANWNKLIDPNSTNTINILARQEFKYQQRRQERLEKMEAGHLGWQLAAIGESVWQSAAGLVTGLAGIMEAETPRLWGGYDADRAARIHNSYNMIKRDLTWDAVAEGNIIDPETGDVNWTNVSPMVATVTADMFNMARGGFLIKNTLKGIAKGGGFVAKGLTPRIIKTAPIYGRISTATNFIGQQADKLQLLNRFSQLGGSGFVLYPKNVQEAVMQIDDDFTAEDAMNASLQKTIVEGFIEMLNPDIRFLKGMNRFKASKGYGNYKLWKNGVNYTKSIQLFKESLKQIPKELGEEFLQEAANAYINSQYNSSHKTSFELPTADDYKTLGILTPLSIISAGFIRTRGFRRGKPNYSMYQAAVEDIDGFNAELKKQVELNEMDSEAGVPENKRRGIDSTEYSRIMNEVNGYNIAKNQIDPDRYNNMSNEERIATTSLLFEKAKLEKQLREEKNSKKKQQIKNDIKNIDLDLKRVSRTVETGYVSRQERLLDLEIQGLKASWKLKPLGSKEKMDIHGQVKKKIAERNKLRQDASLYEFNGKHYNNSIEFANALIKARNNGYFNSKSNIPRIRISNKVNSNKAEYISNLIDSMIGTNHYAKGEVMMKLSDIQEAFDFMNLAENSGKDLDQFRKELIEEEGKEKPDASRLNDLRNAIKYHELTKRGYAYDNMARGLVIQGRENQAMAALEQQRLQDKINAVKKITTKAGIDVIEMTQDQIKDHEQGDNPIVQVGAHKQNAFILNQTDEQTGLQKPTVVINTTVAAKRSAFTAPSHELLHVVLFSILNGPLRTVDGYATYLTPKGAELIKGFLDLLPKTQRDVLEETMKLRGYKHDDNEDGTINLDKPLPFERYAEEYLNVFHDLVVNEKHPDFQIDKPKTRNLLVKIGKWLKSIWSKEVSEEIQGTMDTKLDTPQQVLEFIKNFNKQAMENDFDEKLQEMAVTSREFYGEAVVETPETQYSRVEQEVSEKVPTQEKTKLVEDVNNIYSDPNLSDSEKQFKIASKYRGMAEIRFGVALDQAIGDSRDTLLQNKEDIIAQMLYDPGDGVSKARNVLGLVQDFKTERHKYGNIAAYINAYFKVRSYEVFEKWTKDKGFKKSMEDARKEISEMESETVETNENRDVKTGQVLASERVIKDDPFNEGKKQRIQQYNDNITNQVNQNPKVYEGKNYKTLQDLNPEGTIASMMFDPEALYVDDGNIFWTTRKGKKLVGTSILESIVKKLKNNDNLNQQDIKALQPFISKHNQLLWISLPEGFMTNEKGRPTTATGVQNVLLEPFYNKGKRVGNLFPQRKKPIMPNNFLEVFGITPAGEVNIVGKESNVSQRVKALISQFGKVMTNQQVRKTLFENGADSEVINRIANGKSVIMYSKNPQQGDVNPETNKIEPGYSHRQAQRVSELIQAYHQDPKKYDFLKSLDPIFVGVVEDMFILPNPNLGRGLNYIPSIILDKYTPKDFLKNNFKESSYSKIDPNGNPTPRIFDGKKPGNYQVEYVEQALKFGLTIHPDFDSATLIKLLGFKDGKSINPKLYKDQISQIENRKLTLEQKLTEEKFMKDNGINPEVLNDIEPMIMVNTKIKNIINDIVTKEGKQAKEEALKKHWDKLQKINTANEMGMKYISLKMKQAYNDTKIITPHFVYFNGQMQTNIIEGTRALSTFEYIYLKEGQQVPLLANGKIYPKPDRTKMGWNLTQQFLQDSYGEDYKIIKPTQKDTEEVLIMADKITLENAEYYASQEWNNYIKAWEKVDEWQERYDVNSKIVTEKEIEKVGGSRKAAIEVATINDLSWKNEHVGASATTHAERASYVFSNGKSVDLANLGHDHRSAWVPKYLADKYFDAKIKIDGKLVDNKTSYEGPMRMTKFGRGKSSNIAHVTGKSLAEHLTQVENIAGIVEEIRQMSDSKYKEHKVVKQAMAYSRGINHTTPSRGMSAFDFDETLIDKGDNYIIATKGDEVVRISSGQWPLQGPKLAEQGYDFNFDDFINVRGGVEGPLMQKFRNRIKKFGIENNYILTARPAEAAPAIQGWLKTQGIDMPLENITGLGNSTGEAKALWIAEKFSEGYNDIYFVDDALPNVKAVADMIDQLDIKGKSVQAKIQFSRGINPTFSKILDGNAQTELDLNRILEQTQSVKAEATFSEAQAKIRGRNKGRWKFWVPYSAEDFKGLIYRFVGKGRQGEQHMAFFKKSLFDPFAKGYESMNVSRQGLSDQYSMLNKKFKDVKKDLKSRIGDFEGFDGDFTVDQAIRVYLWNKNGMEVPGLSGRDLANILAFVQSQPDIKAYADTLMNITALKEGYVEPSEYWTVETIQSDINKINNELSRADHLKEFIQNKEIMFGVWEKGRLVGPNMNKIEAIYGTRFREALEDILWRMEFGTRREVGRNRLVNAFNNWANQSVGAIMFFNMRSALLQTISTINYINWSDNNPLKAGAALLNFPQFLKDFTMIFNSDMLKQRRAGNQRGINEAELAEAVGGVGPANRAKAILHYLLTKGFLPTQIADSFAISAGGATFYRNRVNTYLKQGMSQQDAEAKAFRDFQENTEESQQSSRPDMISQQQASPLGRYILAFKNTPMQYARLTKKAFLDLVNGRGDSKTNISKIIYYMAVQNLIFTALQSALGALIGGDEDELEDEHVRIANGMVDSILGGLGFGGNVVMTLKNTLMEYNKQSEKEWNADHTYTILKFFSLSPTIGSKGRKLYSAIQTEKFNEDVINEMSMLDPDNPRWSSIANLISALTNAPLDRLVKKMDNIDAALTEEITALERMALLMGWNTWDLDIDDSDVVAVEDQIKEKKKIEKKKQQEIKKQEKKKQLDEENKVKEDENKKKNDGQCIAISKSGNRCKNKAESGGYCTIHAKVEQGTVEKQCSQIKSNGERCKMKTKAKSGKCYYHD